MLSFRKAYFLKSEPVAIIGLLIFSDNEKKQDHSGLELMVTMYNINYGSNEEIMEACRTLREYAMYVERIRLYAGQMPLAEAVERHDRQRYHGNSGVQS